MNRVIGFPRRIHGWILPALAAFAVIGTTAGAQAAPDSGECVRRLSAPTPDSADMVLRLFVRALDPTRPLPSPYTAMIADGVRTFMELPAAMSTDVFDGRSGPKTSRVVLGDYRALLHRDGRLTDEGVAAGTMNPVLDRAVLESIARLDSSRLLVPLGSHMRPGEDSVAIKLWVSGSITPATDWDFVAARWHLSQTRLIAARVPLREVTQAVTRKPGTSRNVELPAGGSLGEGESATLQFVVRRDGHPEVSTAEVLAATSAEAFFLAPIALGQYQYIPLRVDGCAVPSLVVQTFDFGGGERYSGGGR